VAEIFKTMLDFFFTFQRIIHIHF